MHFKSKISLSEFLMKSLAYREISAFIGFNKPISLFNNSQFRIEIVLETF